MGLVVIAVGIFFYFASRKFNLPPAEVPTAISIQDEIEHPVTRAQSPSSPALETASETNSIAAKIATLEEIATRDDADAFQTIMTELTNASPEIREAALEATIQFGSREAIPVLQELAAKTENAREKVEILDAIEFLELPPFSEVKRTERTNSISGRIQPGPK